MLGRIFGLPVMMRSTPSISDSLGRRTTNCSQSHGARNESSLLPTWTIRASLHCSKPTVPASSCSAEARTLTERCLRCSTGSWPAPPHSASNTQSLHNPPRQKRAADRKEKSDVQHCPASPSAPCDARESLSSIPRCRRNGQMASAERLHGQGSPHRCQSRRHLQNVLHELHDRPQPLHRRKISRTGAT